MRYFLLIITFFLFPACTDICWDGPCYAIPGNTHANHYSQAVAERDLLASAKYYVPTCKDFRIIDTQYNDSSRNGIWWSETWIIDACGTKWKKIFEFSTDGQISRGVRLEPIK